MALGVAAVAVLVRLAFVFILAPLLHMKMGPASPSYYSTDGYQEIARMILAKHGVRFAVDAPPTVFRTPLQPAILAFFYYIANGSEIAVLIQNLLLGAVGCALCALAAQRVFGSRVAVLAGIATAVYPQSIIYSWSIFTETVQFFFVSLLVLCLVYLFERRTVAWGIISGIALGAAILSKGYLLGFPVVLLPAFLLTKNAKRHRGWGSAIALCCAAVVTIAPWTVRNCLLTHKFIPVGTGTGYAYLIGNEYMRSTSGREGTAKGYIRYDAAAKSLGMTPKVVTPRGVYCDINAKLDAFYIKLAMDDLRAHPGAFVKKLILGIPRVWYFASSRKKSLAMFAINMPMIVICILGLPLMTLRRMNYAPFVLPAVYTTVAFAAVQAHCRYSMPVVGLLVTGAIASAFLLMGNSFEDEARDNECVGDTHSAGNELQGLSYFFPVYNELSNIRAMVEDASRVLPGIARQYEIIIVDDGSTDGTSEEADRIASENSSVRVVHHRPNRGYGAALKSGIAAARYQYIAFTDGDRQFDLSEIGRLANETGDYDVVIGYRKRRADSFNRELNAKAYRTLIRVMFGLRVRDIDCAFKLLKSEAVKKIALSSDGALISAELLIKLQMVGYRIKEVPVTHLPRKAGEQTGAKLRVILKMFYELIPLYMQLLRFSRNTSEATDRNCLVS
jgi:hypothetical protein